MKRRKFLSVLAALAAVPLLPNVTEPETLVLNVHGRVGIGTSTPNHTLYISQDAMEKLRSWGVDQVDEQTRREIYATPNISRHTSFHMLGTCGIKS